MKIKSLLLGSAAALVAFSGARAADAIIAAEPEPVEYVRVCDAFGTGYFYIPGTETCLRIHGYVRFDVNGGDLLGVTSADGEDTYGILSRFTFRTSTASETELGTLRTYTEVRFNHGTNDEANQFFDAGADPTIVNGPNGYDNENAFSLNFAWIQLGGLRVGKDESYFTTFTGYGGSVINDTLSGGYGPFGTNLISYTYNSGAFSAGISLEQGVDNYWTDENLGGVYDTYHGWGIDDYMPHVVVGLGYNAGMFSVRAVGAYDTRDDTINPQTLAVVPLGGWAGKIRADVNFNDSASVFAMLMYGENESAYTKWRTGLATDETFSVVAGGSFRFSEKATFNLQGQWAEGNGGDDPWSLVGNVAYSLVPGLTITPELAYLSRADGSDDFGGTFRIQRDF
ncbi:porin-like protein [Hoeflea marina]|uniref:Porin n=1 Tax=Hoeflea marina TaxID=274592 RepID=A0A317PH80_9HYPH|nr:porin [Hoeflea marina]PWV98808.1 porin-like protein [Hoeflea marina]